MDEIKPTSDSTSCNDRPHSEPVAPLKDFKDFCARESEDDEKPKTAKPHKSTKEKPIEKSKAKLTEKPSPMAIFEPPLNLDTSDTPVQIEKIEGISSTKLDIISNKLVEKIHIMLDKGVTTTTIEIGEGRYKKTNIKIVQYDTAPASFNIEFLATPEGMIDFNLHTNQLEQILKGKLPDCIFRIQAALSSEHQFSSKKRRSVVKQIS